MDEKIIADVGNFVRFNGKTDCDCSTFTRDLLKNLMEPGKLYEVVEVLKNYNNHADSNHYKFRYGGRGYWYPCECFDIDPKMELVKKYNLR